MYSKVNITITITPPWGRPGSRGPTALQTIADVQFKDDINNIKREGWQHVALFSTLLLLSNGGDLGAEAPRRCVAREILCLFFV